MHAAVGLHRESLLEAEEQLALLAAQLPGTSVPLSLALLQACSCHSNQHTQIEHRPCGCPATEIFCLWPNVKHRAHHMAQYAGGACETTCLVQGRVSEWLSSRLGWAAGSMLPSVRCGLEGALLSALAAARRQPLHALLTACPGDGSCCCWRPPGYQSQCFDTVLLVALIWCVVNYVVRIHGQDSPLPSWRLLIGLTLKGQVCRVEVAEQPEGDRSVGVAVNALLHSQGTSQERAAEAKDFVHQGYSVLKIKVRLEHAEEDKQKSRRHLQYCSQHSGNK